MKLLLKSLCQRENIPQALSLALILVVTATSAIIIFLVHNALKDISNEYSSNDSARRTLRSLSTQTLEIEATAPIYFKELFNTTKHWASASKSPFKVPRLSLPANLNNTNLPIEEVDGLLNQVNSNIKRLEQTAEDGILVMHELHSIQTQLKEGQDKLESAIRTFQKSIEKLSSQAPNGGNKVQPSSNNLLWATKLQKEESDLTARLEQFRFLSSASEVRNWKEELFYPSFLRLKELLRSAPPASLAMADISEDKLEQISELVLGPEQAISESPSKNGLSSSSLFDLSQRRRALEEKRIDLQSTIDDILTELHTANEEIDTISLRTAEAVRLRVIDQLTIASHKMNWLSSMSLALVLSLGVLLPFAIRKQLTRLMILNKELQKAKDSADIAAKAKAEFLANMSHEIRTPMNGVLGMTQLALELSPTPQIKECLDTIQSCGQGLLGIINDILDLSKIEAGKFSIVPELFNPRRLFDLRLKPFELAAQEKQIHFAVDVSPQVPQSLVGDSLRIIQILNNLLSNAIKFTPQNGTIAFSVSWDESSPGRTWLTFIIQDSGVGIAADHLPLIFTPFSQADASTAKRYGGTGLGLSITHRLVQLMGGSITVESQPGRGSTFRVKLPAAGGNLDTAIAHESSGSSNNTSPQRLEILVVEDNLVNQKLAQRMLQTRGHTVTVAADGEQAIHAFSQKQFDLILMDCQMPGMDGFQTTRAIRKLEVATSRTIPIIALTASVLDEDRRRCEEAGMDGHLAKPIDFTQLEQLLNRLAHTTQ